VRTPTSFPEYHLVYVNTKGTEDLIKDTVIYTWNDSTTLYLKASCIDTFGMGVNCTGVEWIINFGPPNNTETYIQQTERSGRDSQLTDSILLFTKGHSRFCDIKIHDYYENEYTCHWDVLFADFSTYDKHMHRCGCCDMC